METSTELLKYELSKIIIRKCTTNLTTKWLRKSPKLSFSQHTIKNEKQRRTYDQNLFVMRFGAALQLV